jgi:hypothetical protein
MLVGEIVFRMDNSVPFWPDNPSCRPEGGRLFFVVLYFCVVVVWIRACNLLICHCFSYSLNLYACVDATTLECCIVREFLCVVVGFLSGAFPCAVFLAGYRMGTARGAAPRR